jgi:hypothetical protein
MSNPKEEKRKEVMNRIYSLDLTEKEIQLKLLMAAHKANEQRRTMITLFWIFYGIPVIIGLLILMVNFGG